MAVNTETSSEALRAKRDRYVARGVSIAPIFAARAHGARLIDADGREYIDFAGGIGVLNLGHTPDAVVEAIQQQAAELIHAAASRSPPTSPISRCAGCSRSSLPGRTRRRPCS